MNPHNPPKKDRYPGIRSFEAGDERLFYGRTKEIDDLFSLVMIKTLVVLFGKSGLGKSSLLKAGLGSVLSKHHYFPLLLRVQNTTVSPIDTVLSELKPYVDQKKLDQFGGKSTNVIWETINACNFTDPDGNPATPVLIFDQFEELFSHGRATQREWATQMSDLIEGRRPTDVVDALQQIPRRERTPEQLEWFKPPPVKVLFAIRSDRMSEMHQLHHEMPAILQNRYELKPLHSAQAAEAIIKPAALIGEEFSSPPFKYAPETVEEIQASLSNESGEIESFQLQIVCQHIEARVNADKWADENNILIPPGYLGGKSGIENILKNYYHNNISKLGNEEQQMAARKLLEEDLIADERRIGVAEAVVLKSLGNDEELLGKLLGSRLIRPENTRLGRTYEISHDTLVAPILDALDKRRHEEERIAKQKELEEQKRQLAIERKKRQRSNRIMTGAIILMLIAVGATIIAIVMKQQTNKALYEMTAAQLRDSLSQIETKKALDKMTAAQLRDSLSQIATQHALDKMTAAQIRDSLSQLRTEKALVQVEIKEKEAVLSTKEKQKIIDAFYFYGDSLALASESSNNMVRFGFIDKKGDTKIPYNYEKAQAFDPEIGYALVIINKDKHYLGPDKEIYLLADRVEDLTAETEALDLEDQNFNTIPATVFEQRGLKILNLNDNLLSDLSPDIAKLNNLQSLHLSRNKLTRIPPQIGQLDSLKVLNLRANRLIEIPSEIGQLTGLERLFLNSNSSLKILPKEIGLLVNLKELQLDRDSLVSLPPEIGQLVQLRFLSLAGNELKSIPNIGALDRLEALNVGSNKLERLPSDIGQLTRLKTLVLESNKLTEIPKEIGRLENLITLRLGFNDIAEIPPEIGRLEKLEKLYLSGKYLNSLPKEIGQLVRLKELYLTGNPITSLPIEIGQLVNLRQLQLEANQLNSLPKSIGTLVNLEALYLSENKLTDLPREIWKLTSLKELHLFGNPITELHSRIGQLENLEILDLGNTQLESIPKRIGKLENLKTLRLDDNKLTELPKEIEKLVNLKELFLSGNPMSPEEIERIEKLLPNCRIVFN